MLRYEGYLPLSARRGGGGVRRERGNQGLVVGPELELPRFQQRQEVLDGVVGGQELPVECRVAHLCWGECAAEKSKRAV